MLSDVGEMSDGCGFLQVEILRRHDNSEQVRQLEDQLSVLQSALEGVREREAGAREREVQARQAASLAEDRARQLDEVIVPVCIIHY